MPFHVKSRKCKIHLEKNPFPFQKRLFWVPWLQVSNIILKTTIYQMCDTVRSSEQLGLQIEDHARPNYNTFRASGRSPGQRRHLISIARF